MEAIIVDPRKTTPEEMERGMQGSALHDNVTEKWLKGPGYIDKV